MTSVVIALFTLGAVDTLDPFGISILLLLLQLVRKEWHALVKVWATWLTYWLFAVLVYYGVTVYLKDILEDFNFVPVWLAELSVGCAALLGAALFAIRLIRSWSKADSDISKVLFIKSVSPVFLAIYGIVQVFIAVPIYWPLYSFIAILAPERLDPVSVILLLGIFTVFSKIPQFVVYWLYRRLETGRFAKIMAKVKKVLTRMTLIAVPGFLLVAGIWLVRSGLLKHLPAG
jgi:hypothetical protein